MRDRDVGHHETNQNRRKDEQWRKIGYFHKQPLLMNTCAQNDRVAPLIAEYVRSTAVSRAVSPRSKILAFEKAMPGLPSFVRLPPQIAHVPNSLPPRFPAAMHHTLQIICRRYADHFTLVNPGRVAEFGAAIVD